MPTSSHSAKRPVFSIKKAEAIRSARGMSYAAIAKAIGLQSRQAVGHWFRGRGEPGMHELRGMAQALGCHWAELLTDEAFVIWKKEEMVRVDRMRHLSPEELAELDAFLAFKTAKK